MVMVTPDKCMDAHTHTRTLRSLRQVVRELHTHTHTHTSTYTHTGIISHRYQAAAAVLEAARAAGVADLHLHVRVLAHKAVTCACFSS